MLNVNLFGLDLKFVRDIVNSLSSSGSAFELHTSHLDYFALFRTALEIIFTTNTCVCHSTSRHMLCNERMNCLISSKCKNRVPELHCAELNY